MSDTTSGTATALTKARRDYEFKSLDDYITDVSLNRTIGDMFRLRVSARSARSAFVASVICNAVLDLDIGLVSEIVKRIDGMAPEKGDNHDYSNIFSEALLDVLEYDHSEDLRVFPGDPVIVALAKVAVAISVADVGKNMQARKDRQKAVSMILDRVEGRMSEPAKPVELPEYVEADWLGITGGDSDE